jgi:coenzyme F420-0:L-glutamate ligase/coenzyme F420-1:gamma-L-glutamate ligase
MITIVGIRGIDNVSAGDDVADIIVKAVQAQGLSLKSGDILVIAQKIISKAEHRTVDLRSVKPSERALRVAQETGKDPRLVEVILSETQRVVRMKDGHLIVETRQGFVCANAGVDRSNVPEDEMVTMLPVDPDGSAMKIREKVKELTGSDIAVIVSDTFGRPWRTGQTDVAIGVSGMRPIRDYRGSYDMFGYKLRVTMMAVADELASAAELAMGKSSGIPAVLIRGYEYEQADGWAKDLIMPSALDLFR